MIKDVDRIKAMKVYYDKRAPWHDGCMSYKANEQMEQLLRPIVETVIPYISGLKVLEIACGTGNWTEILAKRASSVFAIDSSPAVLDIAGKKLKRFNNITLKEADAYVLEGVAGPFDVAFASDWWSHMPLSSIRPFLGNLHKRIRAGSRVIFIEMMLREVFESETAYYDADGNRVCLRTLSDGSEFEVIKNFPSKNDLLAVLEGSAEDINYLEFEPLKRWMLAYKPCHL